MNYSSKQLAELEFWKKEKERYKEWFDGERWLHGVPPFKGNQSDYQSPEHAWVKLFQEPHYLRCLDIPDNSFDGKTVLEIGCGPVSGASVFRGAAVTGVDPLIPAYRELGFDVSGVHECAHEMMFPKLCFDAVIAVNAIDHVDRFRDSAFEIIRVLKDNGLFAMNVHYHKPTVCEPIELNDKIFFNAFRWIKGLEKKKQVGDKAIWRNF